MMGLSDKKCHQRDYEVFMLRSSFAIPFEDSVVTHFDFSGFNPRLTPNAQTLQ